METKHKPAPWRTEDASQPDLPFFYVRDADGRFVVLLTDSEDWGHAVLATHARLIAASPELLKACQAWDEGFIEGEEFDAEQFRVWVNERRRMARAAIAKAKGESK